MCFLPFLQVWAGLTQPFRATNWCRLVSCNVGWKWWNWNRNAGTGKDPRESFSLGQPRRSLLSQCLTTACRGTAKPQDLLLVSPPGRDPGLHWAIEEFCCPLEDGELFPCFYGNSRGKEDLVLQVVWSPNPGGLQWLQHPAGAKTAMDSLSG